MPSGPKKRKAAKKKKDFEENFKDTTDENQESNPLIKQQEAKVESTDENKVDSVNAVESALPIGPSDSNIISKTEIQEFTDPTNTEKRVVSQQPLPKEDGDFLDGKPGALERSAEISEPVSLEKAEKTVPVINDDKSMQISESVKEGNTGNLLDQEANFSNWNFKSLEQLERFKMEVVEELRAADKLKAFLQKVLDDLNGIKLVDDGE